MKNTIKCIGPEKLLGKINTYAHGASVCVKAFAAHNWIKIYTLRPGAIIPENRWENRVTLRDCVNVLNNKMQCIN